MPVRSTMVQLNQVWMYEAIGVTGEALENGSKWNFGWRHTDNGEDAGAG